MARKKQRELYDSGSINPVMVGKVDSKGQAVIDKDSGKPAKVQKVDKQGRLVWRVVLTKGRETYFDESGRRLTRQLKISRNFHGTLKEARAFRDGLAKQYENVDVESGRNTFDWACSRWVDWMRDHNKASKGSIKQYETRLGYMREHLGPMKLAEIKADDVDDALSATIHERNMSNTTANKTFSVTKRVFTFAVQRDWIVRNPCDGTCAPKADKMEPKSRRSLTEEEAARLRACLDRDIASEVASLKEKEQRQADWGNTFGRGAIRGLSRISALVAVRVLLATGARRGEILGLTWDAVSFERSSICIRQTLTAAMQVKRPKTESGVRWLSVDSATMGVLGDWKKLQARMMHLICNEVGGVPVTLAQKPDTPVCVCDSGTWLDPNHFARWWRSYRVSIGFSDLLIHELRHTSASLLIGHGYDIKTVAHRLGHSKETLTLSQYAHLLPANDERAADLMGSILGASVEPEAPVLRMPAKTA